MPEPIAFFGQRIEGGGEIIPIDALRDFVITNIAFADDVKGNARAVIKVHHTILPGIDSLGGEDDEEEEEEEEEDEEEEIEEQSFVVAHLHPGKIDQVSVNLHFSSEELIGFSVSGDNAIELIGNYVASPLGYDQDPDSDEDGYSGFGESDSDEEIDSDAVGSLPELKRRVGSRADAELEEDDDEDDDDFSDDGEIDLEMIGGEDSEDEDDEDRFEEIDDSKISASAKANGAGKAKAAAAAVLGDTAKPSKKRSAAALEDAEGDVSIASTAGGDATDVELAAIAAAEGLDITNLSKNQRKRLNKKLRASSGEAVAPPKADKAEEKAATTASPAAKEAPAKKEKEAPAKKEKEAPKKVASKKQKLPSGVEIEDIKVGSGPAAKQGNKLGMRYIGRLTNGKQFDSNTSGKPFGFKLGRGEVIKGWDEGLRGMQVGGERRLTIPPASAYGSSGAPPTIPRNATLVFDVKLVEIK